MMEQKISLTNSLQNDSPEIFKLLQSYSKQMSAEEVFSGNLTIDGVFTLKNHKRSKFKKLEEGAFLSLKGFLGELSDYSLLLKADQNILGNKNTAQMFPMLERKIPFQCLYSELVKEYEVSVRFIEKYLELYKTVPNIPIPLAIYSYDDEYKGKILTALEESVPKFVFEEIITITRNDSFGVMKYFYPSAPFRVMDVRSRDPRAELFWGSNNSIIFSWCDLLIESVLIGFLPGTKHFAIQGTALDPQNLLLSGGFSDLGSLVSISELSEEVALESFVYCIQKIAKSSLLLLDLKIENSSMKEERKSYLIGKINSYIEKKLESTSKEYGCSIPKPIKKFLENDTESILKNYNCLT
ncbi:MAG: hypothetical protein CME64_03435 [Halobacteriovoraceae bacterium]|nr:hypothetical protein [Halobacteriovoraceae bacterium]|tara:strand:- start:42677 stop:43738 length:1062 start_codon:yes stop_codon:yes gene_type:complete